MPKMLLDAPDPLLAHDDTSSSIQVLSAALDERDSYTDGHCDRVSRLAQRLGDRCGLDARRQANLSLAARFHDVGKIGIPDNVLLHPGRLGDEQMDVMRTHPERGERLFAATGRADAAEVALLIRHHHEAFDGSGYPDGLAGERIPLEARILTIVDGYDALTSQRPYRGPMPHRQALRLLAAEQGRLIDPHVFRAFVELVERGR